MCGEFDDDCSSTRTRDAIYSRIDRSLIKVYFTRSLDLCNGSVSREKAFSASDLMNLVVDDRERGREMGPLVLEGIIILCLIREDDD